MAKAASKIPMKIQKRRDEATRSVQAAPALPTFDSQIAEIQKRARQRADEEIASLVQSHIAEAERAFSRAVSNTSDEAVKSAFETLQRLRRLGGKAGPAAEGGTGSRVRRSAEDLAADASKLVDWLKKNPGSKGSAAFEATGVTVKPPLNLKTFVEKYLPGTKVKTEGQKAGTTYSI